MNVFYEFHRIVQHLQADKVQYALIGGVAVAVHSTPRYTKDIDFLIPEHELTRVTAVLQREGYRPSAAPWAFRNSGLTLHRFIKIHELDEMIVDVLVAGNDRHLQIIANALEAESAGTGVIRVAAKEDLIWLKRQRNSSQDQADIERLGDEEH